MADWLDVLTRLQRDHEPAVLVTVLTARGSTPREAGCKMVVVRNTTFGTIGGGSLEHRCTTEAQALLSGSGVEPIMREFPLGPALGQCCGGHVSVLFEPMRPPTMHIALFGAGHVGRALVRLLANLPCRVTWIDARPGAFPQDCPPNTVHRIAVDIASIPAGSHVLIMTHDHQLDFEIVAKALIRSDLASIGLIGSATKRTRFVGRLRRLGLDEAAIRRLDCPIGVPGIESKQPVAIAIGVAAQLLMTPQARPPSTAVLALTESPCLDCARHPEGACA